MSIKIICQNKKVYHDYFIIETFEAGIVLQGSEVKSLRAGKASLKSCYARLRGSEVYLVGAHITPYEKADGFKEMDPTRTRKLLLKKKEISKLIGKTEEKGLTLVATKMYFKRGKAKVELGLARGKKMHDKRDTLKKKTIEREMEKAIKSHQ